MSGWICLHRKLLDWEWYSDHNTKILFIHCLLRANYSDAKWKGQSVNRGQFISSLETLSKETGLTISQVRTSIKKLKSTNEIAEKSQARSRVVTVLEYDTYQDNSTQVSRLVTARSQASDSEIATDNNVNNVNNETKVNKDTEKQRLPFSEIQNAWNEILGNDLGKIRSLTDERKKHIKARVNESPKLIAPEKWVDYFLYISQIDFLMGRGQVNPGTGKPFKASLDWVINQSNMNKILEGKYE